MVSTPCFQGVQPSKDASLVVGYGDTIIHGLQTNSQKSLFTAISKTTYAVNEKCYIIFTLYAGSKTARNVFKSCSLNGELVIYFPISAHMLLHDCCYYFSGQI